MNCQKPRSAKAVRLTFDVVADVVAHHGLLSARVVEKNRAHLTREMCASLNRSTLNEENK